MWVQLHGHPERLDNPLGDLKRTFRLVDISQEHGELIAAQARPQVARSHTCSQPFPDSL